MATTPAPTLTVATSPERLTLEIQGIPLGSFETPFGDDWKKKLAEANLDIRVTQMVLDIDDFGGVTYLKIVGSDNKVHVFGKNFSGLVHRVEQTLGARLVDKHPNLAMAALRSRFARR